MMRNNWNTSDYNIKIYPSVLFFISAGKKGRAQKREGSNRVVACLPSWVGHVGRWPYSYYSIKTVIRELLKIFFWWRGLPNIHSPTRIFYLPPYLVWEEKMMTGGNEGHLRLRMWNGEAHPRASRVRDRNSKQFHIQRIDMLYLPYRGMCRCPRKMRIQTATLKKIQSDRRIMLLEKDCSSSFLL